MASVVMTIPLVRFEQPELRDVLAAGSTAALVSGVPSTAHALVTGRSPLDGALAAGTLLLPHERRRAPLLLAAVPVHLALSMGWAFVLAIVLPRRLTTGFGALAGLGIAALDLGVVGRRLARIRALPQAPQVADHLAYGAAVGAVLSIRRARRPHARGMSTISLSLVLPSRRPRSR
jgi:hypothetical protein